MSTAEQIIFEHRELELFVDGDGKLRSHCHCGWISPTADFAAHVVDALTTAGYGIYPEQYVGELRRIEADIEEWANYRVQDFGCKNAKDVLDIINREGEWVDDSAAARTDEGGTA